MRLTAKVSRLATDQPPNYHLNQQIASALSHCQFVLKNVFALIDLVGIKCTSVLVRTTHCDVHSSVASWTFDPRYTTRRLSFTCRLLNRTTGRWIHTRPCHSAQSHLPTRLALHCTIRYLSRLTILVSRFAPPRVLSPTRIPGPVFTVPVRKSGY